MKNYLKFGVVLLALVSFLNFVNAEEAPSPEEGQMDNSVVDGLINRTVFHGLFPFHEKDEAMRAFEKKTFSPADFEKLVQGSSDDYFREMDNGVTLPQNHTQLVNDLKTYFPGITADEAVKRMARGRNNWIVWTGGNDQFWNYLGRAAQGGLDFVKTISSHPSLPAVRSNRWQTLGLVNEPCFKQATGPDPDRWGLWLDKREYGPGCPLDPFSDPQKYPGVKIGARGTVLKYQGKDKLLEVGSSYGYPTGIIGFRLFPNPDFDQKAANNWNPEKYYSDPKYYNDPNTIRPYRVGMSCALCHVGPSPTNPPADFNNPKWSNLNSNPGAQYFWVDRIFVWDWKKGQDNFVYQLLHTQKPGTLDTSLVSSDQINNPRTMNAVYDLPARMHAAAKFNASEKLTGDEKNNIQFSQLDASVLSNQSPLRTNAKKDGSQVLSPRVLKDGSDSVGALGALNRVYLNIGLFSEEWVRHFIPLLGGPQITPIKIDVAEKNSLYWQANTQQTPDLALFFLASAKPDKLANAPGGDKYLENFDGPKVTLGKKVFAENCASCHSSKLPEKAYSFFSGPNCNGKNYMKCWNNYVAYIKTPEFKTAMHKMVLEKDFLQNNFLSNDQRIPVNVTDSQLCSPIATNAIKGDIWDNFSSTSYKELTSVGKFEVNFPMNSKTTMFHETIDVPAGGRGFLRPPSLISVWSTAPFLQNNALGKFDDRGTVEGRMLSFEDSIHKLLNPETRAKPSASGVAVDSYGKRAVFYTTNRGDVLPGYIDVTTQNSYLKIPRGYLPEFLFNAIKDAGLGSPIGKHDEAIIHYDYLPVPGEVVPKTSVAEENSTEKTKGKKNKREAASILGMLASKDAKNMADMIYIGPIPAGVPINLISNLKVSSDPLAIWNINKALLAVGGAVLDIHNKKLMGITARDYFVEKTAKDLLDASTCRDFVVDRGHYFGSRYSPDNKAKGSPGLTADEKQALVEYLKHM